MNKNYKFFMICLFACISVNVSSPYYFPTLEQWKSFEEVVTKKNSRDLYKKIVKKRAIKESMIASPKLTSVKSEILAAFNSWRKLLDPNKEVLVETADGWGSDPRLSHQDSDILFSRIIETGNTVALEHFMQMVAGTSFDLNKRLVTSRAPFHYGINGVSRVADYYSPLKLAIYHNHPAIVEMLLSYGAQIHPSIIGAAQGKGELVEMLMNCAIRLGQANIAIGTPVSERGSALGVVVGQSGQLGYLEEHS